MYVLIVTVYGYTHYRLMTVIENQLTDHLYSYQTKQGFEPLNETI